MAPFIRYEGPATDARWRRRVRQRDLQTWRQLLRRPFRRRGQREIEQEYDTAWSEKSPLQWYDVDDVRGGGSPWEWAGQGLLMGNAGGARVRLLYLMRTMAWLRPRTVLEIGFGNGINLLTLACRFPEIAFAGVELTEGGLNQAASIGKTSTFPNVLARFSPEPLVDLCAHTRVDLRRGTAAALPFGDGHFDLVFSSLALEQMEEIRPQALAEAARVARVHVVMLEPFAEYNASGLRRRYVAAWNYFRGAVAELPRFGLQPILRLADMPAEAWLRPCLVVCTKSAT
jgi:SAM-dependent methyltransferase